MKRTIAARWCERDSRRILLAIGLPLVGPVTALGMGAFLHMAGVRSDAALRSIFMATVLSTLIATAVFAPRTIDGSQYSVLRKCFAGVAGIAAATLVVRTLAFVGIDAEALSNPSRHPAYFPAMPEDPDQEQGMQRTVLFLCVGGVLLWMLLGMARVWLWGFR